MRVLATVCLSFAAGILLRVMAPTHGLLSVLIVLPILVVLFFWKKTWRRRVILISAGFLLAVLWYSHYTASKVQPCRKLFDTTQALCVELCDFPTETDNGATASVRILRKDISARALYYGTKEILQYRPGDRILIVADVQSSALIGGEKVSTYTSQGIWFFLFGTQKEQLAAAKGAAWRYAPAFLLHRAQNIVDNAFSQRTAALLHAMVLGDQSRLSDSDRLHLREAGLYHITAVSGLHCAFLLSLLSFLVGKHRAKLLAAVAIPVLVLYALVVGASPSVVRACIMLIFTLIAPIFRRESDSVTALSFALFVILLGNPYAIESVGLQLSFAAVAGILLVSPRLNRRISQHHYPRFISLVLQSFATTAGASVFTVPLSFLYFDSVSLIAPVSNFLCLWMASFVFIIGFTAVLAGFLSLPLASAIGILAQGGAHYIYLISKWLCKIPYHSISDSNPYLSYWVAVLYVLLLAVLLFRKSRTVRYVSAVLTVAGFIASVLFYTAAFRMRPLTVTALDVGQGSCTVFLTPHCAFMVDCGSGNKVKKAGYLASDYLISAGYRSLDALFVTHFDSDHTNGLERLFSRIKIGMLYLPECKELSENYLHVLSLAAQYHIPVQIIANAESLSYDDSVVRVFPPLGEENSNEEGLSLLCSCGTFDVLITGDMNTDTEEELLLQYALPDIEALVVGHHGSVRSTSEKLLQSTKPDVGLISVGTNAYGHPNEETLERLHNAGVITHRTDEEGSVTITVDRGQKWQIKAMKN